MSSIRHSVERFLEPSEWLGEVLFGLIMVLTMTLGAGVVVADGPDATREILVGVIGCILAWSAIDAIIFAMNGMFSRSRTAWLITTVQKASSQERGLAIIRKELEPVLGRVTTDGERERLYQDVFQNVQKLSVSRTVLQREEVGGAIVTFLLVLSTAVPALVPFLFISDRRVALAVSNALLLGMLFLVGFFWAREARTHPVLTGLFMLCIGLVMVGIAKLLGG